MRITALLHSLSWFQVSLALHMAFGGVLYAAAPSFVARDTVCEHRYAVALQPPTDCSAFDARVDDTEDADEETDDEAQAESEAEPHINDGPTAFCLEETDEHEHQWVTTSSNPCTVCGEPTSWSRRCAAKDCFAMAGGGHGCSVSRCGIPRRPASGDTQR
jgi:hypothetical protein